MRSIEEGIKLESFPRKACKMHCKISYGLGSHAVNYDTCKIKMVSNLCLDKNKIFNSFNSKHLKNFARVKNKKNLRFSKGFSDNRKILNPGLECTIKLLKFKN